MEESMSESQLDAELKIAMQSRRRQRKRKYLEALEARVEPDFHLTEEEMNDGERDKQRPRRGHSQINFPALKYKGGSRNDLAVFLTNLKGRFALLADEFPTDTEKVVYASTFFEGAVSRRWIRFLTIEKRTCSLLAHSKLNALRQAEGEKFDTFLECSARAAERIAATVKKQLAGCQQDIVASVSSLVESLEKINKNALIVDSDDEMSAAEDE
ncbi:hypothetical protein F5Y00DRAFT_256921 [Daldinia vernicosa]|uniref:uncharacterized protein n=1 Tax=Daldinia vernicosa TaxID=114800 RepID=UPI002007CC5F|nr:uncharacterized protein F5Y00DRAFT_256921 [Daldinia vernicosa]KAI0854427.1 hypothetical protein F5Y00DRAFT_256921 [Daldinia vernicosa]